MDEHTNVNMENIAYVNMENIAYNMENIQM